MSSVDHAASLLRIALSDLAITPDTRQLLSGLHQAQKQAPSLDGWRDWFYVACPAAGLKARPLTARREELEDLARSGGVVLIRMSENWVSISSPGVTQVRSIDSDGQLKSDLSLSRCITEPQVDAVLIEGGFPRNSNDDVHPSPWRRLVQFLSPEWPDVFTVLIYSFIIAVLTLATPLAVESLVNTVAFGRLVQPIIVLSVILFGFLSFSAALRALQTFVVEIVQRRLFVRMASDLSWRLPRVDRTSVESRNTQELLNRFFDVVTVQKVVSQFLLDGISIVLTTMIGMAVLAFYHPMLLAFDLVLIVAIALILFVLGYGAIGTSITESKYKYATAAALEEIARCQLLFKGSGGNELALYRVDSQVAGYLKARRRHFRVLIRQTLSALMLQALASTALLALGGWLVIIGELTLGQLVAAELIVSMIVTSVAKFGKHLESFYDLMASIDKLGYLMDLPVEEHQGAVSIPTSRALELTISPRGSNSTSSDLWKITPGECIAISGDEHATKMLLDELYGLHPPDSGNIHISSVDLRDIRPDLLRREVSLMRSLDILEGTITENIVLGRMDISNEEIWDALRAVGLEQRVNMLPLGIRAILNIDGSPLSRSEVIRLVLARSLVNRPQLLLVDAVLDALSDSDLNDLVASNVLSDPSRAVLLVTGRSQLRAACDREITLSAE